MALALDVLWRRMTATAFLIVIPVACSAKTPPQAVPPQIAAADDTRGSRDRILAIPMTDASGQSVSLQARVCRPQGDVPGRLVVINHGTPTSSAERPTMKLGHSAAIGNRKPFPAFYDAVAGKVGFRPDELLLIDDTEVNVRAAMTSGWHARLWKQGQRLEEVLADVGYVLRPGA